MAELFKIEGNALQPAYERLLQVAKRCEDSDQPIGLGAKPAVIPSTLSACDLAGQSVEDRKKLGIEMMTLAGTKIFIRKDELLVKVYQALRRLDAEDGQLDEKICVPPEQRIVLVPETATVSLSGVFHEHLSRAVFEITTTFAPNKDIGWGTAFIIRRDRVGDGRWRYLLVTNSHVVEEGNVEELYWSLSHPTLRGQDIRPQLVGVDPMADIALVEVELDVDLPVLTFGDSGAVKAGDRVVAIGNTMRRGIFAVEGSVKSPQDGIEEYPYPLIRMEIGITNGNSGGPLFNETGQVIGVVARQDPKAIGIVNFSIPASRVRRSIQKILKNRNQGGVFVGDWGLEFWHLEPDKRAILSPDYHEGVWIRRIYPDSPASRAGLRPGDILIAINGRRELTRIDRGIDRHLLEGFIYDSQQGERMRLEVLRGGRILSLELRVGQMFYGRPDTFHTPFPFAVVDIPQEERRWRHLRTPGVFVILDTKDKPLYGVLRNLSVITHVDGRETPDVDTFRRVLDERIKVSRARGQTELRIDFLRPLSVFEDESYGFTLVPLGH